jgi:NAD+ diphosphatase
MPQASNVQMPLSSQGLDRAGHLRRDAAWLEEAFRSDRARVLIMREGLPLVEGATPPRGSAAPGTRFSGHRPLLWLGPQASLLSRSPTRLFLGLSPKGSPVFALELEADFSLSASPVAGLGVFEDFRAAASGLDSFEAGCAATARAVFEWHRRHGFCSACGARSRIEDAGWKRRCESCGAEHFPRVDPVAIMLAVRDGSCLLGRQAAWPRGFWSCLAGFVEPGETIEEAAVRELFEESGVRASPSRASYLFCQPWPFPSSLMMGLILEADSEEIKVDPSELEAARWVSREETAMIMAGRHPEIFAPPPLAVAHHVIRAWLDRTE